MQICDECTKSCGSKDENFTKSGGVLCPECRSKKDEHGLSYDMKKEYLETDGVNCLFCKGDNIEGGPVQVDSNSAWQTIGCLDCDKEWRDIYTLTGVEVN